MATSTTAGPLLSKYAILWPGIRKYWPYIAATVALSLSTAAFEGLSIGMLIPFLQTLASDGPPFTTGVGWIDTYVLAASAPTTERVLRICGIILAATWLRSITDYLNAVYTAKSRSRIIQNLRERVVAQLTSVAYSFYGTRKPSDILNTVTGEVGRAAAALNVLFMFFTTGALIAMYATVMVYISWELSLAAFSVFLVLGLGLSRIIHRVRDSGEEITLSNMEFTGRATEFLAGVRTMVAYNTQAYEQQQLTQSAIRSADAVIGTARTRGLVKPLSQAVISSIIVIMVVWAVYRFVLTGALDMAFILTFLFALFRLTPLMHHVNDQRAVLAETKAGLDAVADLLETSDKPYLTSGNRATQPLQTGITFEHVHFSYIPEEEVLHDINLHIPQGKTTALVGASGAGKSTLVDLIPRFYDPTKGRILYDGEPLETFDVGSLRSRVAIVSQQTHIFNDTVTTNIAYGLSDVPFAAVREAAEQANALQFVERLENGFDTVLGDRGVRLSGGQRQRIAIARAILRNAEILVLDEATSSLDSISERLVQQSLERLMAGRTVIAIAHRLSTIENADWVVVLENGRIVEQGPYADLLERQGRLWDYHSIQFQAA